MSSPDERLSEAGADTISAAAAFEVAAGARRNRLIALWAAEKMGLSPVQAENYARVLENYHPAKSGEDDVIRKISGDLAASNIAVRDSEVWTRAVEYMAQAREALKAG